VKGKGMGGWLYRQRHLWCYVNKQTHAGILFKEKNRTDDGDRGLTVSV